MMTAAEATLAQKNLTYLVPGTAIAREEYGEELSEITGQFRDWLGNEYASEYPENVQGAIFGKAWEYGHSSGYFEVESYYQELAEFAETLRLAFQR